MNVGAKIHDVVHAAPAVALRISPKSGKVLVTGAEDRSIVLWALGRTTPIMTLSGLASPPSALTLDYLNEEILVAASNGGPIKLWDLEHSHVIRTLTGHKAPGARSVEFHPFGEFFASGGADGVVKVWDVRRKGCIQTYTASLANASNSASVSVASSLNASITSYGTASAAVVSSGGGGANANSSPTGSAGATVVRITPDGRWIASGWDNGSVKIWDMTAGRLLKTFTDSTSACTCITFSPYEFIMTVAYEDGTVWFYDLESFDAINSTPYLGSVPRCVEFHESGREVLIACEGSIQVWGWDPLVCCDSATMAWPHIADVKLLEDNKLVGASLDGNLVGVWGLKLDRLKPYKPSLSHLAPLKPIPTSVRDTSILENGVAGGRADSAPWQRPMLSESLQQQQPSSAQALNLGLNSSRSMTPSTSRESDRSIQGVMPLAQQQPLRPISAARPSSVQPQPVHMIQPPPQMRNRSSFVGAAGGSVPLNLDLAKFAPSHKRVASHTHEGGSSSSGAASLPSPVTESDLLGTLTFRNTTMTMILGARLDTLRLVRSVWDETNVKPAVEMMLECRDSGVWIDMLRLMNGRARVFTLDVAILLLPLLNELLFEVYEDYIVEACNTIKLLCKSFAPLIISQLGTSYNSPGIDLQREDRQRKCLMCYHKLMDVDLTLRDLTRSPGRVGISVQEALVELSVFRNGDDA
ncbi:WD40-repeat-containing domain protein [Chytriomyces sp. MP71]|nr:WD40-repeat-containing domain protein [Chytriomyces sp. MP71]